MQAINAAYAQASAQFRHEEMREKAKASGRPEPNEQDYADAAAVDERIRQAIERIITLDGLEIEICGLWVWVGGETKTHKEALEECRIQMVAEERQVVLCWCACRRLSQFHDGRDSQRYGSQQVRARPGQSSMMMEESHA